jgi:hypothetical protein
MKIGQAMYSSGNKTEDAPKPEDAPKNAEYEEKK